MKSENTGADTSSVEVLNVSPHGFWLWVAGREYFLGYRDFPWFRHAAVAQLFHVELHHREHLSWPELDVDLDVDRIAHPGKYPLVAGATVLKEAPAPNDQPGQAKSARQSPRRGPG